MENLSEKVLRRIKEEKICPKPRWQFLLEDYFIWLVFLVAIVLGASAFCAILHVFLNNDLDVYLFSSVSPANCVLVSLPYVWLVVLLFFVWIAYYNFKCTKSGYRHETFFVVGLSVVGSVILGLLLHNLGAGGKIENIVSKNIPFYEKISLCGERRKVWVQPNAGLLGGEIVTVSGPEKFNLQDFNGFLWEVRENEDTLEYEPLKILVGEQVKIIGEKKEENIFWAREIRPWQNRGDVRKAKIRLEQNGFFGE